MGPEAADLDPLEGHCEPPPADGEGPGAAMLPCTQHFLAVRQMRASSAQRPCGGPSCGRPPTCRTSPLQQAAAVHRWPSCLTRAGGERSTAMLGITCRRNSA